jgi:hypothetical protein
MGLVDEIVGPDRFTDRVRETAERLASVPSATFALTKRSLREPFAERARRGAAIDDEGMEVWASSEARESVRLFIERTLGSGSRAEPVPPDY